MVYLYFIVPSFLYYFHDRAFKYRVTGNIVYFTL